MSRTPRDPQDKELSHTAQPVHPTRSKVPPLPARNDPAQPSPQQAAERHRALSAAARAGLDPRVLVRPTVVLGPVRRRQDGTFRVGGSTLRGVLVPEQMGRDKQPDLLTTLQLTAEELAELELDADADAGPAPSPYHDDRCPTVLLPPHFPADLALRRAPPLVRDIDLNDASTLALPEGYLDDVITMRAPSVEEAMNMPLRPQPSAARASQPPEPDERPARKRRHLRKSERKAAGATTSVLDAMKPARPARRSSPPTKPERASTPARAASTAPRGLRPLIAWSAALGALTMLLTYLITVSVLSHREAQQVPVLAPAEPAAQTAASASSVSVAHRASSAPAAKSGAGVHAPKAQP